VLTAASTVQCAHLGNGTPVNPMPRVLVGGKPAVTLSTAYTIAACQFPTMTAGNSPPCVTAQFSIAPSARVLTLAGPLLVSSSNGTSLPNGTPLVVMPDQIKVVAS